MSILPETQATTLVLYTSRSHPENDFWVTFSPGPFVQEV